jgi:hypothetical protein
MENQEAKKEWATPELIVFLRRKPEEAILELCKINPGGSGPSGFLNFCRGDTDCANCNFPITS